MELLSWPGSYNHFNFRGKDYMFFGEKHNVKKGCENTLGTQCNYIKDGIKVDLESDCWNFDYFLIDLFERCKVEERYLDFFLESRYIKGDKDPDIKYKKPVDTYIFRLEDVLKECMKRDRKDCLYLPYVRTHYSDPRSISFYKTSFTGPLDSIVYIPLVKLEQKILRNIGSITDYVWEINKIIYRCKRIFKDGEYDIQEQYLKLVYSSDNFGDDYIKLVDDINNIPQIKRQISTLEYIPIHPVAKQLNKLYQEQVIFNGKNISDLIHEYVLEDYKSYSITEKIKTLKFLSNESTLDDILNVMRDMRNMALLSEIGIMNAYTLARMLRHFDNPSQIAIFYGGHKHTYDFGEFFTKYLNCKNMGFGINAFNNSQCILGFGISDIFHQPILYGDMFKIILIREELEYDIPTLYNRESIYGLLVGLSRYDNISIFIENYDVYVNIQNMYYILRVGSDRSLYNLTYDDHDYYFNDKSFLDGFNFGSNMHLD